MRHVAEEMQPYDSVAKLIALLLVEQAEQKAKHEESQADGV